jgi:hypothetical protein
MMASTFVKHAHAAKTAQTTVKRKPAAKPATAPAQPKTKPATATAHAAPAQAQIPGLEALTADPALMAALAQQVAKLQPTAGARGPALARNTTGRDTQLNIKTSPEDKQFMYDLAAFMAPPPATITLGAVLHQALQALAASIKFQK